MTPANAILDWSWSVLSRTLASLLAHQGWAGGLAAWIPRTAWRRAYSQLRCMEWAARRLLVAMAVELGLPRRPAPLPKKPRKTAPRAAPAAPAEPGFRLFDPLGDPLAGLGLDSRAAPVAGPPAADRVCAAGLAQRLAALSRLLDDPAPAVRRMALWLSRRKRGRTTPIRLGRLRPLRRASYTDPLAATLSDAHKLALGALNKSPPPPPQSS